MKGSGTYTWFGYTGDFCERLRAIKEAGFDTVFTFWDRQMSEADAPIDVHTELADRYGLRLEHAHLPYYGCNVLWHTGPDTDDMMAVYKDGIETAGRTGLKTLVIHPCEIFPPEGGSFDTMTDNMRKLLDTAERSGVRLAFENLGENGTVSKLLHIFSDRPAAGLCFDSGHNNIAGKGEFGLLSEFVGRVFALHIHDNNGTKDQHLLPFSEGCTLDWGKCVRALDESGFEGSLMLEACYPIDYTTFETNEAMYSNPDYPMESYLRDAFDSCARVYKKR